MGRRSALKKFPMVRGRSDVVDLVRHAQGVGDVEVLGGRSRTECVGDTVVRWVGEGDSLAGVTVGAVGVADGRHHAASLGLRAEALARYKAARR
jgi:hypothetical protein